MDLSTKSNPDQPSSELTKQGILPFYHMVSDADVPYVKHLYSYRSIKAFEADLDHFLKHYRPIDLPELRNAFANGEGMPSDGFFLSFDDGFRELYEIVRPLLLKKGIPATFFINSAFLDNRDFFYRNKVSLLIELYLSLQDPDQKRQIDAFLSDHQVAPGTFKERIKSLEYPRRSIIDELGPLLGFHQNQWLAEHQPYLTSDQVREMIADGFTFGGHSIDHPKYMTIGLSEQIRQTRESVEAVATTFNLDYRVFAFPFHDQFVSQRFFDTLQKERICELSFGTAELQQDRVSTNLQRMWFENTDASTEQVINTCFSAKQERISTGTDVIRRPFSELRTYTVEALEKMIESGDFWRIEAENIPITRYRARAHSTNPRANAHDLALVTMYDGDRLIGYLGVMPGTLFLANAPVKIGWLTCWWTHPDYGGKGVGQSILDRIAADYNGHIGCSEFTDLGQMAAERSGKLWKCPIAGRKYSLANQTMLEDWVQTQAVPDLEYINEIDEEAAAFIANHQSNELCKRGVQELNWMLRHPWVISAPFEDRSKQRLFFSSTAKRFFYQAFKVYAKSGALIGVVILRIRDQQMTVPYLYVTSEQESHTEVAQSIAMHAAAHHIDALKVYHPVLIEALERSSLPKTGVETITKNAFFGHIYDREMIESRFIQDGDGDNAFT